MHLKNKNIEKFVWGGYALFLVLIILLPAGNRLSRLNSSFHNSNQIFSFYLLLAIDLAIILVPIGFVVLMSRKGSSITAAMGDMATNIEKVEGKETKLAKPTITRTPQSIQTRSVNNTPRRRKNKKRR